MPEPNGVTDDTLMRAIAAHRRINPAAYRGIGLTREEERSMVAALEAALSVDRERDRPVEENERLYEHIHRSDHRLVDPMDRCGLCRRLREALSSVRGEDD
jgi:hypothetical protein